MKKLSGWVAVVLAAIAALVSPSGGSERSKRLYNKGLVEFHAGQLQEALKSFGDAVEADPLDALAWYYRGVALSRTGDRAAAIQALRKAWELNPKLFDAALDLGIALAEAGEFSKAIQPLEYARNAAELEAQALLYLGIALFRLDRAHEARSYFWAALEKDPELEAVARYHLGVLDYQQGFWQRAKREFERVRELKPGTPVAEQSQQFLARIAEIERERWTLFGSLGLQYDSNVILAPSSDFGASFAKSDVGVTRQADGRATFQFGGSYQIARTPTAQLAAGYEFYQSLHFELRPFDLQDHRAQVAYTDRRKWGEWGALGRYDYYLLDTDDFLREGSLLPFARIDEGNLGWTELSFQLRRRDFLKPEFHIRDSINYVPGAAQVFFLQSNRQRYLTVSYFFEVEDTAPGRASRAFAYTANQIGAGLAWALPWSVETQFDYAFRHKVYEREPSNNRKDQEHRIILLARRALTGHISVTAAYFGQLNFTNSTQLIGLREEKLFEYERHIGSITIEARY
ncbi:MAG: tetratricopeptide repeat protein [Candidatus Binatia bacterium]|nr:tetratricopeptide repeat protein [Candidatus Binatia bacterium]